MSNKGFGEEKAAGREFQTCKYKWLFPKEFEHEKSSCSHNERVLNPSTAQQANFCMFVVRKRNHVGPR